MTKQRKPVSHAIAEGCPVQYLRMECGMPAKGAAKHHVIAGHRQSVTCPGCKAVVDRDIKPDYGEPASMKAYAEWACGDDSGVSSLTLLSAITGVNFRWRWRPSTPSDHWDFGRCVRLLDRFPELRPQLGKVADKHADWAGLVAAWADLEALYREDDREALFEAVKAATK